MDPQNKKVSAPNGQILYKLQAPDGGWGYMVAGSSTIIMMVSLIPIAGFGLIFGKFLRELGDEAEGITWITGSYNTINSFTGLLAGVLLNKYSYRKVGFLGSILFIMGAVAVIFAKNLVQMVLFFGLLQGVGFGLLLPSMMSAFNAYFDKKMSLMMSATQTIVVIFNIAIPHLLTWCMETIGYRGTLIFIAACCGLCIPAVAVLQPVESHMKKLSITTINSVAIPVEEPLMEEHLKVTPHQKRSSVISIRDCITSVNIINEKDDSSSLDFHLLKSPKYLNITFGLGLAFIGDINFITIVPMILTNQGFTSQDIAFMLAVLFGCDLFSRILLTIVSYFITFRSRLLFLVTAALVAITRIAFALKNDYMWKLGVMGVLGFLRCFIMTPIPLVLAEEYPTKFSTAFSLSMVVGGFVILIMSMLMDFVMKYTGSDLFLCQILTLGYMLCVVCWTIELTCCKKSKKNERKK
ncbi:monocarboxylate transporter 7-like [Euwallacea similis]|uniref:monocarboxylate transporter 7-like n=1 Tax=Euwallacea similis TaxID=1736056 RepID=UPI00344E530F